MAAVHSFPGKQFISKEAATALIEGGTKTVSDDDNRVVFTYDPRHRLPSMSYMTKGQVMSFFKGVSGNAISHLYIAMSDFLSYLPIKRPHCS
jgi:hypothetical protein